MSIVVVLRRRSRLIAFLVFRMTSLKNRMTVVNAAIAPPSWMIIRSALSQRGASLNSWIKSIGVSVWMSGYIIPHTAVCKNVGEGISGKCG